MRQKTQNHFLKFSIHLSVRKSRENYRQIYGKSKASLWRNLSTGTPPHNPLLLQLQFTIDIFFRTAVLRKLFDIRFSYKHCNFSRGCLLVKMASKTVTKPIIKMYPENLFTMKCIKYKCIQIKCMQLYCVQKCIHIMFTETCIQKICILTKCKNMKCTQKNVQRKCGGRIKCKQNNVQKEYVKFTRKNYKKY